MKPLRRVLVNGAAGALGSAVIAALGDRAIAGTRHLASPSRGAINVPEDGRVDPARLEGVDAIINCAGRVRGTDETLGLSNVVHVSNLVTAASAAGVGRFVNVSSFAVYGAAERIGAGTPIGPSNAYGRSKAQAERLLEDVPSMSTLSMRLPFLFDHRRPALLGSLIKILRHAPFFPAARYPVLRSMLTYPDAAALLVQAADDAWSGSLDAADPEPFSIEMLARTMREAGIRPAALLGLPLPVIRLVARLQPAVATRLFMSSVLDASANWAIGRQMPVGLAGEIRKLIAASGDSRR